jgi:hypothetical protein
MMTGDPVWRLSNGLHGPTYLRRRRGRLFVASAAAGVLWGMAAVADPQPQTINGVPQQIIPQVGEVGLPAFTYPTGTVSSGSGTTGTGTTNGGTGGSALDTMNATSWGAAASQNAQALGVNASALAATCVAESGCQNVGGPGSAGAITGAFQMTASTYQSSLAAALQQDPSLASNIVPGLAGQNDPATQAIAAAEYLKQGAQYLQNNGVSDPTALDVRGYYNFGPQGGAAIANAQDSDSIANALSMYTPAQLAKNGITPGETVGQWRSGVASKMGDAANAVVLA